MDKLTEIKSGLENVWSDLKQGDCDPRGVIKDFEHLEKISIETLTAIDKTSSHGIGLTNFISVARDVESGSLNVDVDYTYICEQIEKVIESLSK